ncbi:dihydroorotase [Chitinimonas lacunae]|uniref:Dihydroorotase n=1 Tax=Chitinimonas lacunae TaxID=1963018 RepID=A0ABV8MQW3_9NEIS
MKRIAIVNARLVDPVSGLEAIDHLYLADGQIVGRTAPPPGFQADETIDGKGLICCPGLVDLSARLGEPGGEQKRRLQSELAAAVAGGITALCCPPDTDPNLDEPGLVQMLKSRADALKLAQVYPIGALTRGLTGQELTEMAELRDAGCVAFSQADAPLTDHRVLFRAMQYAATFDLPLRLRPQDATLAAGGVAHDGEVATRLGLPGIPTIAETISISTLIILMKETGARVHLERLSSREGVEMVYAAKRFGLPITCDVSINHVHLADIDIGYFDTSARLNPPLRSTSDREAIQQGLVDGTIDAICSDHCPIEDDDKLLPFGEARPGATGLELLLPLTLAWGAHKRLPLAAALAPITAHPARLLGLPTGALNVGRPADLCLFDAEAVWRANPEELLSQGKYTPFAGMELHGKVRYTLVGGTVAYRAPR